MLGQNYSHDMHDSLFQQPTFSHNLGLRTHTHKHTHTHICRCVPQCMYQHLIKLDNWSAFNKNYSLWLNSAFSSCYQPNLDITLHTIAHSFKFMCYFPGFFVLAIVHFRKWTYEMFGYLPWKTSLTISTVPPAQRGLSWFQWSRFSFGNTSQTHRHAFESGLDFVW